MSSCTLEDLFNQEVWGMSFDCVKNIFSLATKWKEMCLNDSVNADRYIIRTFGVKAGALCQVWVLSL